MEIINANSLEEAVAGIFGEHLHVVSKRPVYGGDINEAYRLSFSDGGAVFMKCNSLANLPFFEAEAKGLEALQRTRTIGVPKALGLGIDKAQGFSFLLMEYLEAAPKVRNYPEVFGRELAMLHRAECSAFVDAGSDSSANSDISAGGARLPFGFETDNYIGASVQINTPKENWVTFFRECRLFPQMRMAEGYFDDRMCKKCGKLLDHLDSYLVEPEFPSLIHGDLWSGNAVCGPDGKAWILDPAAYVGHFEAELAMTELFGGYAPAFYDAYQEVNRIDSGYRDRRDLYNLYHLLNHLNLFGGSYLGSVKRIVDRYV